MKKIIISLVMFVAMQGSVYAALSPNANLSIDAGSTRGYSVYGDLSFFIDEPTLGFNGINLGTAQRASGSHGGEPDGSESPDIDQPWEFFGSTGMNQSRTPVTVLSDDGAGNVTLDFSGWAWHWNGIEADMGDGPSAGIATMICASDCSNGDSYTLSYVAVSATDSFIFVGVPFRWNYIGTISEPVSTSLPIGTVLGIETGNANVPGSTEADVCTTGSCFGMDVGGIWVWANVSAGSDGGLVVGKNQASGGQEVGDSLTNITPGEMTDAWSFFGAYGTFFTVMGNDNIFDSESCNNAGCAGKTVIPSFDVAWNGSIIPMGDADSVNYPGLCFQPGLIAIDWQVNTDGSYVLDYTNDVPQQSCVFQTQIMRTILRGQVLPSIFEPPTAGDIAIGTHSGLIREWIPDVTSADGYPVTCSILSQPTNGVATVDAGCTFGTYQSNDSFTGIDTFMYTVTAGGVSATATVTVNVSPTQCHAYPLKMVTTTGGGQSQSVNGQLVTTFTGRLTTEQGLTSGAKNKVTICPGSTVEFDSVSTVGTARCSINGIATAANGTVAAGDKLICTNKPDGSDIDRFSVKNGL